MITWDDDDFDATSDNFLNIAKRARRFGVWPTFHQRIFLSVLCTQHLDRGALQALEWDP